MQFIYKYINTVYTNTKHGLNKVHFSKISIKFSYVYIYHIQYIGDYISLYYIIEQ